MTANPYRPAADLLAESDAAKWDEGYLAGREDEARARQRGRVDDDRIDVGRDHDDTSHEMRARCLPRSGQYRRTVYDLIAGEGEHGMTADEVEDRTHRSHASASSAVSILHRDGFLRRTDRKRNTRAGNPARVYVAVPVEEPR